MAHSLLDAPHSPNSSYVCKEYNEEDDDVVFAVDCSTHEEIPLTTIIIDD